MSRLYETGLTRREVLRRFALSGAAVAGHGLLTGCAHRPALSPIDWQPRIQYPVFYGFRDLDAGDGVATRVRVFFPSLDRDPGTAAILQAWYPYPIALFLHGHCEEADHYQKWEYLPGELARSGYVVAVLDRGTAGGVPSPEHPDISIARRTIEFLRSGWEHGRLVEPAPATAVIGHSFGALIGAYLVVSDPGAYSAFVSLSGALDSASDPTTLLRSARLPGFYLCGTSDADRVESRLRAVLQSVWEDIRKPKYRAELVEATHWSYLPRGRSACGPVALVGGSIPSCAIEYIAADLVAVFVSKYAVNRLTAGHAVGIPDSLHLQSARRTPRQEEYAQAHLVGLSTINSVPTRPPCVRLSWETDGGSGSRALPGA